MMSTYFVMTNMWMILAISYFTKCGSMRALNRNIKNHETIIPIILSIVLFMEYVDATILNTAIPTIVWKVNLTWSYPD